MAIVIGDGSGPRRKVNPRLSGDDPLPDLVTVTNTHHDAYSASSAYEPKPPHALFRFCPAIDYRRVAEIAEKAASPFGAATLGAAMLQMDAAVAAGVMTEEEKGWYADAVVAKILEQGVALDNALLLFPPDGPPNASWDQMKAVAEALGHAYESGVFSSDLNDPAALDQLEALCQTLGDEATSLVAILALDPANGQPGGILEALGNIALAQGNTEAAMLAFSSSPALVEAHLPQANDQWKAHAWLTRCLALYQSEANSGINPSAAAEYAAMLSAELTLAANGHGYDAAQLQELLAGTSPQVVSLLLSQARSIPGQTDPSGAVELLGQTFEALALSATTEEDRQRWQLNAAIAYTSSDALIEKHLPGAQAQQALELLSHRASELYDDAVEAEGHHQLVELPELLDGMARLLDERGPELLDAYLGSPDRFGAAAELTEGIENLLYSPFSTAEQKGAVQDVLETYLADSLAAVNGDQAQVGQKLGALLAITQTAARNGIERARSQGGGTNEFYKFAEGVAVSYATKLVTGLFTLQNPLASIIVNKLVSDTLGDLLHIEQPSPEQIADALEERFRQELSAQGADANFAEAILVAYTELYADIDLALAQKLALYPVGSPEWSEISRYRSEQAILINEMRGTYLLYLSSDQYAGGNPDGQGGGYTNGDGR